MTDRAQEKWQQKMIMTRLLHLFLLLLLLLDLFSPFSQVIRCPGPKPHTYRPVIQFWYRSFWSYLLFECRWHWKDLGSSLPIGSVKVTPAYGTQGTEHSLLIECFDTVWTTAWSQEQLIKAMLGPVMICLLTELQQVTHSWKDKHSTHDN